MKNIFDQIRDQQVEAPLGVMESAIQRANQRRRRKMILRWASMCSVITVIVFGLWPNPVEKNQPQIQTVSPSQEKSGSVDVPEINKSTKTSESEESHRALIQKTKRSGSSNNVSGSSHPSDNAVITQESQDLPKLGQVQAQDSVQRPILQNENPTQSTPTGGSKVKQSKQGTRKLKLIVPKP
ncbi:MAG: hypothetical protein FJX95_06715 [Bacteroidetes bacterium]|nr:hypothetical protein [Bacteroidota bacterium]